MLLWLGRPSVRAGRSQIRSSRSAAGMTSDAAWRTGRRVCWGLPARPFEPCRLRVDALGRGRLAALTTLHARHVAERRRRRMAAMSASFASNDRRYKARRHRALYSTTGRSIANQRACIGIKISQDLNGAKTCNRIHGGSVIA